MLYLDSMQRNKTQQPDVRRIIELQELLLAFHAIDRKVFIPPSIDKAET